MEDKELKVKDGWSYLIPVIIVWLLVPIFFISGIANENPFLIIPGILTLPAAIIFNLGLFTLQPNEARVLVLFGKYVGTVRNEGFYWTNPFMVHRGSGMKVQQQDGKTEISSSGRSYRISLRARNFQTGIIKVNDQRGNPIEIAAVVVWRVNDCAKAMFDVDQYEQYVEIQSETAIRHMASNYPYDQSDDAEGTEITIRGSSDIINAALEKELQSRLDKAGVVIEEARLTHLAYAPEIAQAMLRRQQAQAVIAARKKIVTGAVSMVEMALAELSAKNIIELDQERKAAMVGNLLVVLCGDNQAEPVINTGTLYH